MTQETMITVIDARTRTVILRAGDEVVIESIPPLVTGKHVDRWAENWALENSDRITASKASPHDLTDFPPVAA